MYDCCIIGGGASGLLLAVALAREGGDVILFEKSRRVGKRLLATGNGRCNITNLNISPKRFNSRNRDFIGESILPYRDIEKFFNSIGLHFKSLDDGRVFPLSLQAITVVELLEYELSRLNVKIVYSRVEKIDKIRGVFKVSYGEGRAVESKVAVIATGSIANPKLGGSRDGLNFAKSFNHKITPLYPSLVQLTSSDRSLKGVAGVKVEANIYYRDISIAGDILFTNMVSLDLPF